MKQLMKKLESLMEKGGTKKDITLLVISGIFLILSLTGWNPLPFDLAWISIILCGVPIILEAIIGLVTAFDIKADVLVSIALVASVCIGEDFAAGEVAFIMQLGGLLEDLTVARARAGIEKLVLATPTAIMAAIGNATKHGFLVREGDALERLASVTKITFDKTGTLTYGIPQVIKVVSIADGITSTKLYCLCASAEQLSEHPLGKAIARSYKQDNDAELLPCENFQMLPGRGVCAEVSRQIILAGNLEMLTENKIDVPEAVLAHVDQYLSRGCTVTYLAVSERLSGYIVLSDTVREESVGMIDALKDLNVQPVLLTGDNERAASAISAQLHIEEVHADCLPKDKLNWIDAYQKKDEAVCMIGDGVNDAPALKKANVGIAMGGVGSDIAVDAADIALVDDEVKELPHLIALSKRMMTTIKLNMTFSMTLNFIAIVLAIIGTLNPVVGALVHNTGSVLVIINSSLLLKWRKKQWSSVLSVQS